MTCSKSDSHVEAELGAELKFPDPKSTFHITSL